MNNEIEKVLRGEKIIKTKNDHTKIGDTISLWIMSHDSCALVISMYIRVCKI